MLVTAQSAQFQDLINGDPLLLRTTIPLHRSGRIQKGDTVKVVHERDTVEAKIISDPITIISRPEEGYNEISIEVIKN